MTTLNPKALSALDKKALVDLLVEALAQEPTTEEVVCGFPTLKGTPCSFTGKHDGRCKKHEGKALPEQDAPKSKGDKFYEEVIVGKAEQRKTRKANNRALAKALRAEGKVPNGDVWDAAKYLVEEDGLSVEEAAELA